jgi:hypothetical protein
MAVGSSTRRTSLALVMAGVCVAGAACGGGSAGSSAGGSGGSPATTAPSSGSPASSATVDGLNQAKLGGLQNYTFTSSNVAGSVKMTWTGKVHSPTDWVVQTNAPAVTIYDVNGQGTSVAIGQVESTHFQTPQGVNHLFGEPAVAASLFDYTHVADISITKGAPCTVAGASGVTYHVQAPNASIVDEMAQACVDSSTGALLSYSAGVTGGSAANAAGVSGHGITFTVTSIGGVGQISAPAASSSTTIAVPNAPTAPPASGGLPTGFPSQVPAPPGTITADAQISATKWTLQVSETSASAITDYEKTLEARGFSLTSQTSTAAGDFADLADGSIQIVLEQLSLPGQGVILSVTVGS